MDKLSIAGGALENAFWVFVGIVAGAVIQFGLYWLIQRSQRANAKKVFLAEISLNRIELEKVIKDIERKKTRFLTKEETESDFWFDLSGFNYRIVDPLINSGQFHSIMWHEGVKKYFSFMGDLNPSISQHYTERLRIYHQSGQLSLFFDELDRKMDEWRAALDFAESRSKRRFLPFIRARQ